MESKQSKSASAHKRRLHGLVMRWARMEMAVRMAGVGGTDRGDEMSDDAETAKLEVLQFALPGKWRQWKKAHNND